MKKQHTLSFSRHQELIIYYLLFLLVSALSLGFAYYVEYYLGINPCILCYYQRYPYFAILCIAAIFLLFSSESRSGMFLILISLVINFGIAFYHTGVERGIFEGTAACQSQAKLDGNVGDLTKFEEALSQVKPANCQEAPFRIFGFSMTEVNLAFLSILIIICSYMIIRTRPKHVFKG